MAENLGTGVSFVADSEGYNYDTIVFQKGKPPLDTELNETQDIRRLLSQRQEKALPSGWLTLKPVYTSSLLSNEFNTQNPSIAIPEYALVNGMVLYVTNTKTSETNSNLIDLDNPPSTGNVINGVFLEVWRALLDPDTSTNRPDPKTVIDSLMCTFAASENIVWAAGENGLILNTENGGQSWSIQLIDTKKKLNDIFFITSMIGWVVGDGGIIGRTTSGGDRWNLIQSGFIENFNSIHAYSQLIAWIVGDTGLLLKTTNGINWVSMVTGVTVNLNCIHFYDNLVGWVVGNNGTILRTTNGGSNWIPMTSGTTENLNNVHFYDLNFGFAVGDNGTILRSSDGGLSWVNQSGNVYDPDTETYSNLSVDYTDVTMVPNLDEFVDGEDVTSQFTGSNKNFTVMNVPVTVGDGLGITTNNPAHVTVYVEGIKVLVDSLIGNTGHIILHEAPRACDEVKIDYSYKISSEIFRGKAWITGESGTILKSSNIGAQWIEQDSDTSYDLHGVSFVNQSVGWLAGNFSVIRHTENGGKDWTEQKSDVISRQVQRTYYEGNIDTVIYLNDESIHPDTNIETSKRVQVQYRVRIVSGVDPANFPEAGLGSTFITALGPNTSTGSFAYENMGITTGDYGLWRARCSGTVDGYCWAIPMFFVSRRNSSPYNISTNSNGSHSDTSVRPDFLISTNIVDSDILDVRRLVNIKSVSELLDRNFDALMNNSLRTRFFRDTQGGDKYGIEILQIDRVGGIVGDGGEEINVALTGVAAGNIFSNVNLKTKSENPDADKVPESLILDIPSEESGIFHPNPIHYSAIYIGENSIYHQKPIPGYFTGFGSSQVIFVFSKNTKTKLDDNTIQSYLVNAKWIDTNTTGLNKIPSDPKLTKNYDGTDTDQDFYYQGVFEDSGSKILEQWDSGIPGYTNYSKVYPASEVTTSEQSVRASTIEVHKYIRLTTNVIVSTNQIKIDTNITATGAVSSTISYKTYTIKKINNISSGFSYKIQNITFSESENKTYVTSVSGFPFIEGTIIEIIYMVLSEKGNQNIRNGASVNFIREDMKIDSFCYSAILEKSITTPPVTTVSLTSSDVRTGQIDLSGGTILGISATETITSLQQAFCWVDNGSGDVLTEVTITGLNTTTIILTFSSPIENSTVSIQAIMLQDKLLYQNMGNADGLLIGYNYIPYQSVASLPLSITVKPIMDPKTLYVSSLGTGGSFFERSPYSLPLINIPTNDVLIENDNNFYNADRMRFPNFTIDSGFVELPVFIPGSLGEDLTLSGISQDNLNRGFYNISSKEFSFISEGLRIGLSRKIFVPLLCCITESSDNKLLKGEYVIVIISRHVLNELDNYTGYEINGENVIAVYRLPNKPLSKI